MISLHDLLADRRGSQVDLRPSRGLAQGRPFCVSGATLTTVDIEAVVAALGTRFDPAEAALIERMLREYGGTIPDGQLIEEAALALAIFRRGRG